MSGVKRQHIPDGISFLRKIAELQIAPRCNNLARPQNAERYTVVAGDIPIPVTLPIARKTWRQVNHAARVTPRRDLRSLGISRLRRAVIIHKDIRNNVITSR